MQNQVEAGTRLSGRPLALARSTWVVLVLSILVAYSVVVLENFSRSITICDSGCSLTPTQAATWTAAGLTPAFVILFNNILSNVLMPLGFVVIAALIAWRKSDDWMALLVSFSLVALGPYLFAGVNMTLSARPGWQLLTLVLLPCTTIAFTLLYYLFPDGRLVPRWMRWLFLGYALLWVGASLWNLREMLVGTYQLNTLADTATIIATLAIFCGGILAQVYRFARVSHTIQRQQTKWVVFGLAGPIMTLLIWFTVFAPQQNSSQAAGVAILSVSAILTLLQLAFPASLAIAILRYRLFDIDIIIRRTLIYSIITALLALSYFGAVVVLQQIFRSLTGAGDDLAIIISTLAIAALFNPLRHRVQDIIDHRFYRRKYDAQQVLARFAQTARDEVVLEKLTDELLNVVNETMQPASVSVWLRKTEREVKR